MEYVLTADALTKKYKNFNTYSDCYRSEFSPDSLFTDYTHTIQPTLCVIIHFLVLYHQKYVPSMCYITKVTLDIHIFYTL